MLPQLYRRVNLLSIDVVIGAIISALYFGRVFEVSILPYGIAALGLTVWIIYTADHLRDARSIRQEASSLRHRFHQKHFRLLLILLGIATTIDVFLLFFIRRSVFVSGLLLTFPVGLYLLFQARLHFLKEIFVALLYTIGVLLPSLAVTENLMTHAHVILMFQFFSLALLNLLIFSLYDHDKDLRDGLGSIVTTLGERSIKRVIVVLFVLFAASSAMLFIERSLTRYAIVLIPAVTVLLLIFINRSFFAAHDRYRILGDAIFYFPALTFLYG